MPSILSPPLPVGSGCALRRVGLPAHGAVPVLCLLPGPCRRALGFSALTVELSISPVSSVHVSFTDSDSGWPRCWRPLITCFRAVSARFSMFLWRDMAWSCPAAPVNTGLLWTHRPPASSQTPTVMKGKRGLLGTAGPSKGRLKAPWVTTATPQHKPRAWCSRQASSFISYLVFKTLPSFPTPKSRIFVEGLENVDKHRLKGSAAPSPGAGRGWPSSAPAESGSGECFTGGSCPLPSP